MAELHASGHVFDAHAWPVTIRRSRPTLHVRLAGTCIQRGLQRAAANAKDYTPPPNPGQQLGDLLSRLLLCHDVVLCAWH